MISPGYEEYLSLSKRYDVIPVYTKLLVDTETPITIFRKLVGTGIGCLLESIEGGQFLGRYSFIAYDPFMSFCSKGGKGKISYFDGTTILAHGNPLQVLNNLLKSFRFATTEVLPRFYGGAIGYFAYDLVHQRENIPGSHHDGLQVPDCQLFFPSVVVIYDHLCHQLTLVVNCYLRDQEPDVAYQQVLKKLNLLRSMLTATLPVSRKFVLTEVPRANLSDEEFISRIAKAVVATRAGSVDQVVLSRRYTAEFDGDDFEVYRRLRSINPSPYMFYLNQGGIKVIGSSPEMLVRVEKGRVITCPIAGTRRRGKNAEEDQHLVAELLTDPKELAEHEMLVDFAKNDLRQVCTADSIKISQHMEPQYYSHVIHLASQVDGELASGIESLEALTACFPAGTVTGSPRKKAMEIIHQLEPHCRGIYAGAVGYIGFNGVLDTAIAIRTLVVKENRVYLQAGAGIVADSVPERECEEVNEKAKAMFQALGVAEDCIFLRAELR